MSAQIFVGGLVAIAPETAAFFDANLAKPLFARFYAKLLIPRLGT
jgi:hypothetical protein